MYSTSHTPKTRSIPSKTTSNFLDAAISNQFEAYGVITAPSLGECRWQSLHTNHWKRQPILSGLHVVNDWTSAQWPVRPQYVLSRLIDGITTDSRNRPVHHQHPSAWNTCFVSHCVRLTFCCRSALADNCRFGAVYMICAVGVYV